MGKDINARLQEAMVDVSELKRAMAAISNMRINIPRVPTIPQETLDMIRDFGKYQATLMRTNYSHIQGIAQASAELQKTMRRAYNSSGIELVQKALQETRANLMGPNMKELQKVQDSIKEFNKTMIQMQALSSSALVDALQRAQFPSSVIQALSTVAIDDLSPYFEEEAVQEGIQQEIDALEQETDPVTWRGKVDAWATTVLDTGATIREKSPALYLLVIAVSIFMGITLQPALEDIAKEKIWHLSDYLEADKPKDSAKQIKQSLSNEYGIAVSAMNQIRVTSRETPVFRSEMRISGAIDMIAANKPVIIIQKKRNWSFVMYESALGEEVNGWVFTGNLVK